MVGRNGTLTVDRTLDRLRGSNPLDGLADPHLQAERIDYVASFPLSGDLMLLGAWDNGTVITFEDQIGTHGGLGGPQEKPFLLYPAGLELPSGAIQNPCDLYPIFARYLDEELEQDTAGQARPSAEPEPAPAGVAAPPPQGSSD
jgi:hypothetical protein